jgi:DNA-binding transcriptional regulator of glucitol operon
MEKTKKRITSSFIALLTFALLACNFQAVLANSEDSSSEDSTPQAAMEAFRKAVVAHVATISDDTKTRSNLEQEQSAPDAILDRKSVV